MADDSVPIQTLQRLFVSLDELDKQELIRAAGLSDTRPPILRGRSGAVQPGVDWVQTNSTVIAPLILRWIDADDNDVATLVSGGLLHARRAESDVDRVEFSVRFSTPSEPRNGRIPLSELTANAIALSHLMIILIAANRPFGEPAIMPEAKVTAGSATFGLAGPGLLGFGLMVVSACSGGVLTAPFLLPVYLAGGTLAAIGGIETVLNWRKTAAEYKKITRETRKLDDDHEKVIHERRMRELDIVARELEIEKLRSDVHESRGGDRRRELEIRKMELEIENLRHDARRYYNGRVSPPASALVPLEEVRQVANSQEIGLGYAHQVLNRTLPVLLAVRAQMPGVSMAVTKPLPMQPDEADAAPRTA